MATIAPGAARLAAQMGQARNGTVVRDIIAAHDSALDLPGMASASGLELPDGLPYSTWENIGKQLARIGAAYRWWVGDWLNYGEAHYGDRYSEAIVTTGLNYDSVTASKWVAGRIEFCRRRQNLSWSHHCEVAALEPEEQDHWLSLAETNHWNRQTLRQWLKGPKALAESGSRDLEPQQLLRFCAPDMPTPTIVALMLRVFFPDAATALDMTYGSGAFWDGSAHVAVMGIDSDPTRALHGEMDFRDTTYADGSYDVVLFDPPHLADGGDDSIMAERFGTYSQADLEGVIRDGCREAWRVARLGVIVKITDSVHGQRYVLESDWVREAIGMEPYDVVYQTRARAMVDPKWGDQLSAWNNGSTYLAFRSDGPLHRRRP